MLSTIYGFCENHFLSHRPLKTIWYIGTIQPRQISEEKSLRIGASSDEAVFWICLNVIYRVFISLIKESDVEPNKIPVDFFKYRQAR